MLGGLAAFAEMPPE